MIAAAGVMSTQTVASAQPDTHTVKYVVTTQVEANYSLYYLAVQPGSQAELDANSSAFLRNERVQIAPGKPWVFETTVTDPSWAFVTAGSAFRVPPNPHCEVIIDGQIAVQQDGVSGAQCMMRPW